MRLRVRDVGRVRPQGSTSIIISLSPILPTPMDDDRIKYLYHYGAKAGITRCALV